MPTSNSQKVKCLLSATNLASELLQEAERIRREATAQITFLYLAASAILEANEEAMQEMFPQPLKEEPTPEEIHRQVSAIFRSIRKSDRIREKLLSSAGVPPGYFAQGLPSFEPTG